MNEYEIKKRKILFELIDKINDLKNNSEDIERPILDIGVPEENDSSLKHNYRVFYINLYVLNRLYSKELNIFKQKCDTFGFKEYFDFIETLNLPPIISEIYLKMPQMLENRKILSYITDIPSFMGMIKD